MALQRGVGATVAGPGERLDSVRLVTVSAATEDVVVAGDAVTLSDHVWLGDDGTLGTLVTAGDVMDVTGAVALGTYTGTDELPHAIIPSNVEVAMDTIAAR
ncbi:MAG: hypothetical protein Q4P15_14145 [Propionibacteriaceae bacterium]|nr:hypothetical protein [Propionibacteriaceae bacterium]